MSYEAMREQLQDWVKNAGEAEVREAFELFVGKGTSLTPNEIARFEAMHRAILGGTLETRTQDEVRARTLQLLKNAGIQVEA